MKEIKEFFQQLHFILGQEKMDIKTFQEFYIMANELTNHAIALHQTKQRERRDDLEFFHNADVSDPFSFGQCGDHVYWKVVDRVLYIGGSGPMWDFDNSSVEYKSNDVYSPWRETEYDTVIILDGVTTIGTDAFHGATVSGIIIPNSIKTIKSIAFFDARIEKLFLPESIETIEEQILSGFSRVVDSLTVSVNIANPLPFAFFNRNDILANNIYLCGTLPDDLTPMVTSCLFHNVHHCKIFYPEDWDEAEKSFYERLAQKFPDCDEAFLQDLKRTLIPYEV